LLKVFADKGKIARINPLGECFLPESSYTFPKLTKGENIMQTVTISLSGYFTSGYPVMGPFASYPQTYDLPAGKNLVIESMSASAGVPKGQSVNLWLDVADQKKTDIIVTYHIPLQYQATYSSNPTNPSVPISDWRSMNQALRAYVPMGTRLYFQGYRGLKANGNGGAGVVITGYLEP
jgi:hypothetical protein